MSFVHGVNNTMNIKIDTILNFPTETSDIREEIDKLKVSIGPHGLHLLHPVTMVESNGGYKILAGRKRLIAFKELGLTAIPANVIQLGDRAEKSVSFEENLRRYNLPWYEIVELERQFHLMKLEEHGEGNQKPTGAHRPKARWSMRDTAEELGKALGLVSQDIQLANAIRENPSLINVKDKVTALKLIRRVKERTSNEDEALMVADFQMNQVFLGDSLSILPNLPPATFDCCITDPPWIDYSKDKSLTMDESTLPVFKEIYRVLKPSAMLYAVVSTADWHFYQIELPKFGFHVQKYPIIWHKTATMTHGRRPWEYARNYEPILVAAKGSPVLSIATEITAIHKFPSLAPTKMIHPHEKPVDLIIELLKHATFQGSKVLDPFAGSGATLQACKDYNRNYIGIERNQEFYNNIVKRLQETK